MSDSWYISVQDRAYGPYTEAQLEVFVGEGRLAPHSLIARAGETQFRMAGEEPTLSLLFQPAEPSALATPMSPQEPAAAQAFGRHDGQNAGERAPCHHHRGHEIAFDHGSREEMYNLGPAHPIMPQAWLVACELPVTAIRNLLVQKLGKLDMIFIIDATHDKASWFNFGPRPTSGSAVSGPRPRMPPAQRVNLLSSSRLGSACNSGHKLRADIFSIATCCSLSCRIARPGEPTIKELSGNSLPSEISVFAPTMQLRPIFERLSKVDPIPISELSPTVVECRMTLCPTVTFAPMVAGCPDRYGSRNCPAHWNSRHHDPVVVATQHRAKPNACVLQQPHAADQ